MEDIFLLHCPALIIRSKGATLCCQLGNLVGNLCTRRCHWQLGPLGDDAVEAAVCGTGWSRKLCHHTLRGPLYFTAPSIFSAECKLWGFGH